MLLSAVIASSRPMITATIHAGAISICTSEMNAAEVSSLSASGSIIWPSGVICLRRRARYPSSQSVNDAMAKMAAATICRGRPRIAVPSTFVSRTTTRSGTRKMRVSVRAFGRFMNGVPLYLAGALQPKRYRRPGRVAI